MSENDIKQATDKKATDKKATDKKAGRANEDKAYINCRYNRKGLCILSDCPCLREADKKLLCSSFKEG